MAITQIYKDMDQYFRYTTGDKVIINHLAYLDSDDMATILEKLTTVYDSDVISTIPTCDCGTTKGRFMIGFECPECSTPCADPANRREPVLWFEALDKTLPFINPAFWNCLSKPLSKKIDILRWLSDPKYNPPVTIPNYALLARDEVLGGERSYATMVNKFPELIMYFINSTELKSKSTYQDIVGLYDIFVAHKDSVLCNYLPIMNKKMFVIENTTKGKYTSLVLGDIIDVVTTWLKASAPTATYKQMDMATGALVSKLSALYIKYYKKYLLSKSGSFRKHIYGARSHFTFRTVISASVGKHKHNEIIPPWVVSVTTYRPHIMNKLVRRGYSYKAADKLLNQSVTTYHPVIEEIQNELIAESPYPQGLPVLVNRNQLRVSCY